MNTRKGDLKTTLSHNHVQLGYSVGNHLSVFGTGYWRRGDSFFNGWGKKGDGSDDFTDDMYEVTGGVSYFATRKHFSYEIHIGGGGGHINYGHAKDLYQGAYDVDLHANKATVFIQPSISYHLSDDPRKNIIEVGAFVRVSGHRYHNMGTTYTITKGEKIDRSDNYFLNRSNRDLFFTEPGISLHVGGSWLKFNMLTSAPISLQGNNVRYRSANVYMGFFININALRQNQ